MSGVLAILGLAAYTRLRAGQMPNLHLYLPYLLLYTVGGHRSVGPQPWTPWVLVATPILTSLGVLLVRWSQPVRAVSSDEQRRIVTLAALTMFGIVQFSYFSGRMDPSNLKQVAVPSILLTFYGLSRARAVLTASDARRVYAVVSLIIGLYLFSAGPAVAQKAGDAVLPSSLDALTGRGSADPQFRLVNATAWQVRAAARAVELIDARQWPDRIPMAVDEYTQTTTLLETGHANWFPVSDPCEAELNQASFPAAQVAVGSLRPGQWVIVDESGSRLPELSRYYVELMNRRFAMDQTGGTTDQVVAVKLGHVTSLSNWRDVPYDDSPGSESVSADCP